MIHKWWNELKNKFPNIELDQYVIMPNHFHGIILIIDGMDEGETHERQIHQKQRPEGRTHRSAPTVNEMIQWFKTMTTNEYIRHVKNGRWKPFSGRLWQPNYFERIIRNEKECNQIRQYIADNPLNWDSDEENF